MSIPIERQLYSLIISTCPDTTAAEHERPDSPGKHARIGDIDVDWVDFVRDKDSQGETRGDENGHKGSGDMAAASSSSRGTRRHVPGSSRQSTGTSSRPKRSSPSDLSLQPLLAHLPGQHTPSLDKPHPLDASVASGTTHVGRGVVHLFRHAPPASLLASLDAHPVGEGSRSAQSRASEGGNNEPDYAGQQAEGEDGSLVAILAVPAWMRPADFIEFIGGWATCLEGVRMIRYVLYAAHWV